MTPKITSAHPRHRSGSRKNCLGPLLVLLLVSGCSEPPPKEINDLKTLGWSVQQLTDLITVEKTGCNNEDLRTLSGYAEKLHLQNKSLSLNLSGSRQLTPQGFAGIQSLANVVNLNASGTSIDGASLAAIAGWSTLRTLDLSETSIQDQDLAHLSGLTNLNILKLNRTSLVGAGFTNFQGFSNLKNLYLNDTRVDNEGLQKLPDLPALRVLELVGSQVTSTNAEQLLRARFKTLDEVILVK